MDIISLCSFLNGALWVSYRWSFSVHKKWICDRQAAMVGQLWPMLGLICAWETARISRNKIIYHRNDRIIMKCQH